jgi:hypothetical protein
MYIASTRAGDAEENHNIIPLKDTIIVLADADLFSECLAQAIGVRFSAYDIVSVADPKTLQGDVLEHVKLILLYHLPSDELQEILRMLRSSAPSISIGLVVETIDLLDPYVAKLVEARNLHGVLPLNLRLDVFMAAIDLLTSPRHCCGGFQESLSIAPRPTTHRLRAWPQGLGPTTKGLAPAADTCRR